MNLPFLLGVGSLEIEERRPRSANEPRVKRLYFTKNRRHVTDDRYRGRRGFSDDWAMVPYSVGQRRQNQIEEFDRRRTAAQLRFDEQEFRRQQLLNNLQLQQDEERHRRRTLEARQLNDIILQGQQIPPYYWQRMQEIQRNQDMQRRGPPFPGHGEHQRLPPHGDHQRLPPIPPEHELPGGGRGHGDNRPRIIPLSPGGGHDGGGGEFSEGDRSDESEHECHPGDRRDRSRSSRRDHHARGGDHGHHGGRSRSSRRDHHARGGDHGHHGGRRRHDEQDDDIVRVESGSEDGRPQRRLDEGHGQRLPSIYRRRPRSRSRAHRNHSRPSPRRTPSRHRRIYFSDDSDTESEYEHVRIIRPRSRGSLRRGRSQSRHYEDYSSDDSFEHYNPRPRFRLSSKPRRRRSRY